MALYEDIGNAPGQVYDFLKRKYVSLTTPDEEGDYSSRKGRISRNEKLAEVLSQMGAQEQAVSTAGGITAPVSGMGALARGLTSFGGSYLSGKAAKDAEALDKASLEKAAAAAEALYKMPDTKGLAISNNDPGTTAVPMEMNMPTLPGQKPSGEKVQYTLNMPNIPGREIRTIAGGARPYEDQQRLLREYRLSSDPNVRQMATEERALIEAERDRDQPKMVAAGANGMIDSNPNSPTYGQRFAVPSVQPADLPSTVDEFNFAKTPAGGGFKGSYTDWLKTKTGATTRITVDGGRRDFSLKTSLRKEFNLLPDVKAFNDVASSYDVISDIANRKQPSPQDDLSLIYSYVKMLDPNSVVREGEFATAENSASVPDRIRNAYNKVIQGTRLNSDQRSQYSNAAKGIYESRSRRYNDLVSEYSDYAKDAGLDPNDVFRARGKAGPAVNQGFGNSGVTPAAAAAELARRNAARGQ